MSASSDERPAAWRGPALLALAVCALRLGLHLALRRACAGYTFVLSPTELARAQACVAWARSASWAPAGGPYWLPLPFAAAGALLRLRPDPFLALFAANTACSLAALAGVVALGVELSGQWTGAAAGLLCALSATGVVLGAGGSADPFLHAGLVWALFFWCRFERAGRASDAWLGGLCLAAASLSRFEAWPAGVAAAAALFWARGRRAWPAALCAAAVPAAWLVVCFKLTGDPLAFARETADAQILRPMSPERAFLAFLTDFFQLVPVWLLGLLALAAAGAARVPKTLWAALAGLAAVYVLPSPWAMTQVDEHPWVLFLAAAPAAAAALESLLRGLPARRRLAAAAALLALYAAWQAGMGQAYASYYEHTQGPLVRAWQAARRLRAEGALAPSERVLVELPEGPGLGRYRLWTLGSGPGVLFDRDLRAAGADGRRLDTRGNPSLLDGAGLAARLRARSVGLVVVSTREAQAAAAGLKLVERDGPFSLWAAPDALAAREARP